mmetsp:Transcript_76820/g.237943  ORF Transcript_76820/g.237943 Transcript_76820/m.237943 type:complete len:107 (-) Transcript_76820:56-376(-)
MMHAQNQMADTPGGATHWAFLLRAAWAAEYTKPPTVLPNRPDQPRGVSRAPKATAPYIVESTPFAVPATAVARGEFADVHQKVAEDDIWHQELNEPHLLPRTTMLL